MHTTVAGSGFHLRSAPHIALILPAGTNPGLHMKNISAPSKVFRYASIEPSVGGVGSLQLTGWREMENKNLQDHHNWLEKKGRQKKYQVCSP